MNLREKFAITQVNLPLGLVLKTPLPVDLGNLKLGAGPTQTFQRLLVKCFSIHAGAKGSRTPLQEYLPWRRGGAI